MQCKYKSGQQFEAAWWLGCFKKKKNLRSVPYRGTQTFNGNNNISLRLAPEGAIHIGNIITRSLNLTFKDFYT